MAKYNGHASWAQWNVSLWINNDEGLYRSALRAIALAKTKDKGAKWFMRELEKMGLTHTPDGARYTKTAIRNAMIGL